MKPKVLISVDSGKYATKAIMYYNEKEYYVYFRTKMQQVSNLDIEIHPGSYYVKFNGKNYLIGDMIDEAYSDFNLTKESAIHKICIYTAITQLLKQAKLQADKVDIRLAVNIPISSYKDRDAKQRYLQYIENQNNPIMMNVNGTTFYFALENTIAVFEGVGNIYHDIKAPTGTNTTILDIGGLNTTLCQFAGLTPDFNSMVVANSGINILKGKIGRAINERFGITVNANDLERIIQNGYLMHEGKVLSDSHDIIGKIKKAHFNEIISFAKSRGFTFNNTDICFVGGGSLLLQSIIKQSLPNAEITVNPQFANIKSFLQILKIKNNL